MAYSGQYQQSTPLTNTNLFVNYLPPTVSDDILRQMFTAYGEIESCKVMLDLTTGQSRCFGFVKFKTTQEAEQAILSLNGYRLENKTLVVKPANNSSSSPLSPSPSPPSSSSRGIPSNNLYIKGLPVGATDEYLLQLFGGFGSIIETKLLLDQATNYSRGMGFVRFSTIEEAENAIETLNGQTIAGSLKPLLVKFADTDDERKSRQQMRGSGPSRYSPYGMMPQMGMNFPSYSNPPYMNNNYNNNKQFGNQMMSHQNMGFTQNNNDGGDRNIFIYHLPGETDEAYLYKLFSPYGAIESVKVITDLQGTCKGYGFVKMVNVMDAWNAIQMLNGAKVGEKYIQVSIKKSKH